MVAIQLVHQGHNNLRYLITSTDVAGGAVTLSNAQLQADTLAGPLWKIARAKDRGLGTLRAGVPLTQDHARAILCGDNSGASVGNKHAPRAITHVTLRSGTCAIAVDANVDGDGRPQLEVTTSGVCSGFLDIIDLGSIDMGLAVRPAV